MITDIGDRHLIESRRRASIAPIEQASSIGAIIKRGTIRFAAYDAISSMTEVLCLASMSGQNLMKVVLAFIFILLLYCANAECERSIRGDMLFIGILHGNIRGYISIKLRRLFDTTNFVSATRQRVASCIMAIDGAMSYFSAIDVAYFTTY